MNYAQRGLGEPVTIAAALTAAAKSGVVEKFSKAVSGLFETKTDRERRESARLALAKALDGDMSGLEWLLARSGARPNPAIVKTAPKSVRHLFRTALRSYYKATGTYPPLDIAKYLSITVPAGAVTGSAGGLAPQPVYVPAPTAPASGASPSTPPLQAGMPPVLMVGLGVGLLVALLRGSR